jgi:hypothetical protein
MSAIRIVRGNYRGNEIRDTEFTLVSGFQTGARGNYVTVVNEGHFPKCPDTIRVRVDSIQDFVYTNGMTKTAVDETPAPVSQAETDEQAMDRIRERFDILHEMTKATVSGDR